MSKTKKCVGKEGFDRMNYLYQLSNNLATQSKNTNVVSSLYTNLMISISKRTVQRIDVNIKRTICKSCRSLLLAGTTARVRIRKKKLHWTCLKCNTKKVFELTNKNYKLWTEEKESIVETLDYSENSSETNEESVVTNKKS